MNIVEEHPSEDGGAPAVNPDAPALVVGIGASAGGLDALERLFEKMPLDTGAAFVVVQHLSPDHRSLMDELLARFTRLPIVVVDEPTRLRPNTIFLLASSRELEVEGDRLLPFDRSTDRTIASPINRFFLSLAGAYGDRAIAVVLSGTGSDGSLGVRAVHDAGGLVVVQAPETAKFDGMPRAALRTAIVDITSAPEDMGGVVARAARGTHGGPSEAGQDDDVFELLRERMFHVSGIDFRLYKPATLLRRLRRRMEVSGSASLGAYCEKALLDPAEVEHLVRDALIGVTRFFRDPEAFESLRVHALPDLLASAHTSGGLRVWVPGCSTGEEAYSLAMLLMDALAENPKIDVRVIATDVQRDALRVASDGLYEAEALSGVPVAFRERYFVAEPDGRHRVAASVRRRVLVSAHNVLRDIPFNRIDAVSCRNLLIYLNPEGQARALAAFAFSLRLHGWLMLGSAESVPSGTFETVDGSNKLFRKVREGRMPGSLSVSAVPELMAQRATGPGRLGPVYDLLLERFVPTGVLVNERRELLHVFGDAGRFLRPPPGRTTLELLSLCDGELRAAVSVALGEAARRCEPVVVRQVHAPGGALIDVEAQPLGAGPGDRRSQMVIFREVERAAAPAVDVARAALSELAGEPRLAEELRQARASFAAMLENYEAATEELQASNEELVAGNEELQSTNEELQSVNEELHSVNAEYNEKISAMTALEADLRNLISVVHAGVVFTDEQMRIRLFSPGATAMLNLLPADIGRPLGQITSLVVGDALMDDLAKVQAQMLPVEAMISTPDRRSFRRVVRPYRDADGKAAGFVVTFTDASDQQRALEAERRQAALINAVIDSSSAHVAVIDRNGIIIATNRAWDVFGLDNGGRSGRLLVGMPYRVAPSTDEDSSSLAMTAAIDDVLAGRRASVDLDYRCDSRDEVRWFWMNVQAIPEPFGGAVISHTDISARKRTQSLEQKLREAARLESLGMLAGGIAHDFNNILTGILANASLLRTDELAGHQQTPLAEIERAAERAALLCQQMLTYAGRARLNRSTLRVSELVRDSIGLIQASSRRGARFELSVGDESAWIEGDAAQLQQLFMNLTLNASEALPAGGGAVRVMISEGLPGVLPGETEVVEPAEPLVPHLCVEVVDDGCGIDRALHARIFEPFYSSKFTGRGLGLAAVLGTIRSHGGALYLWSRPGVGTRFRVLLKKASAPVRQEPAPAPRTRGAGAGEVLVVDDEQAVRDVVCRILARYQYRYTAVGGGEAAIALLTAEPARFSAVLLDLTMPGVGGVEVLAEARRVAPGVKVILTSGYSAVRVDGELGSLKPDAFLQKPMGVTALLQALDVALSPR